MGRPVLKVGVLTSSRADYGILLPLLRMLENDTYFEMQLIVFGSHLSEKFGYTFRQIESDGFKVSYRPDTIPEGDSPGSIARSMGKTVSSFADIWESESYDLLIALGDRYEVFSAASSALPFNIPIAHIHGGETTLGAIDNAFRDSITSMSEIHFTACEAYKERVIQIKGNDKGVFNVGALSIDLISGMKLLTPAEFFREYGIDLNKPTILFTFHPETVNYKKNEEYIVTLISVLKDLKNYQVVITMPNADTSGNIIRHNLTDYLKESRDTFAIESLGSLGYLSCMKHCAFMLGNSSSGFVEASWFSKPVINVGRRQEGRFLTSNIHSCSIDKEEVLNGICEVENKKQEPVIMPYGDGKTASKIIDILKKDFTEKK